MDHTPEQYRSYVLRLGGIVLALLAVVFTINTVVDPLWHFRGNRLSDLNYRFEERRMKLNLFLDEPEQYDCLIFGASRATLLDESLIGNSNCFNMAFSLGHVREYVLISEYLAERGYSPDRVIVAIDEVSFQPRAYTDGEKLPEFIVARQRASLPVQDYLGVTTLRFSYETVFDPPTFIRAYERREGGFRGILMPTSRTYNPQQQEFVTEQHFQPYDERMVDEFFALREVFPDAVFEGYIPPLSDWSQARIDLVEATVRAQRRERAHQPLRELGEDGVIEADALLRFVDEHQIEV